MTEKKKWTGTVPDKCNFCGDKLTTTFTDGQTVYGSWAIMCPNCHNRYGVGVGLGKGQTYDVKTGEKIKG